MTTIPESVLNEVATADIETLYSHVRLLRQDETQDNEDEIEEGYGQIKYGINLMFNINHILRGKIYIKEKNGKVIIAGKVYNMEEYWDEMEAREDLARSLIYKYMDAEDSVQEDD